MAGFETGGEIPASGGCTYVETLAEESWGDLLRATHPSHGSILLVRYTTAEGRALFEEIRGNLEKWRSIAANRQCAAFLTLHEIIDGENPASVVEDPGGRPIGSPHHRGGDIPREPVLFWQALNHALVESYNCDFPNPGINPTSLFATSSAENPWRIVPIAPGARLHANLPAGGSHTPPEIRNPGHLDEMNPDSYSIALMAAQWLTGKEDPPHSGDALRELLPYQRLRVALTNGLKPFDGKYGNPKLTEIAVARWLKVEMEEDLREIREAKEASERTPFQQQVFDNRENIKRAAIGAGVVLGLLLLIFAVPRIFTTRDTVKTPYGIVNLFHSALVERDLERAKGYTSGEATPQAEALGAAIRNMEDNNLASRFTRGIPQVAGSGNVRTVKSDLRGQSGDTFMQTEMEIRQVDDGTWRITKLFFESARDSSE